jgi:two-component system cell cycle response regulator DivK
VTSRSPSPPACEPTDAEPRLVLIVDDNEKNLKLARDVLQFAGFRTLEAASGAEGIALAAEHLPDVILMDLRLPDMDGTDAARKLAEGARTAQIPVVALSSVPLEGDRDWFLAAGFAGYLEKPFSVGKFPGQVRRYCTERERDAPS